jgi:general stress protein 26
MSKYDDAIRILDNRFGCDSIIAVATMAGDRPDVRNVDAYYEDGAFYVVTSARSNKMKQIAVNTGVAICGEWFTAHGVGENLGWVRGDENAEMMSKLRAAFAEWYGNGHVDEENPHTCLLRIRLTDGVLFHEGTKYAIDFAGRTA